MHLFAAALLLGGPFLPLAAAADRFICGTVSDRPDSEIPKYLRCGFEGSLDNPKPYIHFTSSYEQCRDACLVGGKCKAFSFAPSDSQPPESSTQGTCTTFRQRVVKQGSHRENTGVYFWNRKCFNINGFYADRTPIVNGGFNSGSLAPWEADYSRAEVIGGSNPYAEVRAECNAPDCQDRATNLDQSFDLCSGTTYSVSFDIVYPSGKSNVPPSEYGNTQFFVYISSGPDQMTLGEGHLSGTDQINYTPGGRTADTTLYAADQVIKGSETFTPASSGNYFFDVFVIVSFTSGLHFNIDVDNVAIQALP